MQAALSLIMVMCLNSGKNYHLCFEEYVQCSKEIAAHADISLTDAALWCDAFGKEIDSKLNLEGK